MTDLVKAGCARFERVEGRAAHLYLCPAGVITTAVGHALPSLADALALPWYVGARRATDAEVARDYAAVAKALRGMVACAYEHLTECRLRQDDIERIKVADVERFATEIRAAFPPFDGLPLPAREAMLDIAFNCGVAGLMKFERMLRAVENENWSAAARESHRKDVSWSRNEEIADLLRSAALHTKIA